VSGKPVLELRFLPKSVPTLDDLQLPSLVESLSSQAAGLIVVTGLAGSGKSSTIAAMIGSMNSKEGGHITTIDEPIRYFHVNQKSFIEQRQIAIDTPDFSPAIEQALADRSSVVAMSDVPDWQSFSTILAAASRALIVCRVAAPSSPEAIQKLINLVPGSEQKAARNRLAESLSGIICLTGLPAAAGAGMVAAAEVLGWRSEAREAILNPERTGSLVEELKRVGARIESTAASVQRLRGAGLISSKTAEHCQERDQECSQRG
jgi:Tfp pilus assembly pilus retraction ATPase PilT